MPKTILLSRAKRNLHPGLPPSMADREICQHCKQPLAIELEWDYGGLSQFDWNMKRIRNHTVPEKKKVGWRYATQYGHFHSYQCAVDWANQVVDGMLRKEIVLTKKPRRTTQ